MREEFLVEVGDGSGIADLAELNRLFTAWCERVYHARPHSETGQPPIQRWLAGAPFPVPDPARLREAFLWSEHRIIRKDATLSLFGVLYQVSDLSLAGRKTECVFDPFDMSVLEVRWNRRPHGTAVPRETGRDSHPKAKPEQPDVPPAPTGIDYLALIRAEHEEAARRDRIRYDALAAGGEDQDTEEDGR